MAEIKSTLDLVMEKTKHLILSDREREAMERREHLARTAGLVQQTLDGALLPEKIPERCAQIPERFRSPFTISLTAKLLEKVDFSDAGKRCVAALKALSDARMAPRMADLERLLAEHAQKRAKLTASRQDPFLAELAARGISGDAIVLRSDRNPAWEREKRRLQKRLQAIRNDLLAACQTAP